jgi:hypothetical protein
MLKENDRYTQYWRTIDMTKIEPMTLDNKSDAHHKELSGPRAYMKYLKES